MYAVLDFVLSFAAAIEESGDVNVWDVCGDVYDAVNAFTWDSEEGMAEEVVTAFAR